MLQAAQRACAPLPNEHGFLKSGLLPVLLCKSPAQEGVVGVLGTERLMNEAWRKTPCLATGISGGGRWKGHVHVCRRVPQTVRQAGHRAVPRYPSAQLLATSDARQICRVKASSVQAV